MSLRPAAPDAPDAALPPPAAWRGGAETEALVVAPASRLHLVLAAGQRSAETGEKYKFKGSEGPCNAGIYEVNPKKNGKKKVANAYTLYISNEMVRRYFTRQDASIEVTTAKVKSGDKKKKDKFDITLPKAEGGSITLRVYYTSSDVRAQVELVGGAYPAPIGEGKAANPTELVKTKVACAAKAVWAKAKGGMMWTKAQLQTTLDNE